MSESPNEYPRRLWLAVDGVREREMRDGFARARALSLTAVVPAWEVMAGAGGCKEVLFAGRLEPYVQLARWFWELFECGAPRISEHTEFRPEVGDWVLFLPPGPALRQAVEAGSRNKGLVLIKVLDSAP